MKKISKKIFISLFAVVFSFAFIFAFVAVNFSDNKTVVKADEVFSRYSYLGKELFYFDMLVVNNGMQADQMRPYLIGFNLVQQDNGTSFNISFTDHSCMYNNLQAYTPYNLYFKYWDNSAVISNFSFHTGGNDNYVGTQRFKILQQNNINLNDYTPLYCKCVGFFNCNVYSINIKTVSFSDAFFSDWTYFNNKNIIQVTYTDTNGNWTAFQFFTDSTAYLSDRTYYINSIEMLTDNELYNMGYNDGINSQQSYIASDAYNSGYANGYSVGDNAGFNRGVLSANDYSFIGLIGATIDAPIKALTGLLNFEILGVNLSAFIYGLFSITLVIIVIKYIKGGK